MNSERFCVKFFVQPDCHIEDEASLIPIFHEWIRLKKLDQICIDVADYRHVPEGPGVMVITHEINFSMDHGGGMYGLSAQQKLGSEATVAERVVGLVRTTAKFGALLESDPRLSGQVRLAGERFHYIANDRLLAPNTEESFAILKPELESVAATLYPGQSASISRLDTDPRDRLTVEIQVTTPVTLETLASA